MISIFFVNIDDAERI